jgi:hypothetical protein
MFLRKSVDTQRTTRHYIPEDDTLHNHRSENLKSYMAIINIIVVGGVVANTNINPCS